VSYIFPGKAEGLLTIIIRRTKPIHLFDPEKEGSRKKWNYST
jgi:hypothetical protein